MWRDCGGGRRGRGGTTAVVRPAATATRRPELRRGWLDGGAAPAAARGWCGATTTLFVEKKSFARHESSKGEFELMTPLKAWKAKEEI
ncbi:hypothetical protein Scep_012152 [Stephania cephalantha]|uniref:Uncharacterized protein n=1 Tax=Stephania cephalantha TaxID=152367 RepID=A0AAP0P775_9MAGN